MSIAAIIASQMAMNVATQTACRQMRQIEKERKEEERKKKEDKNRK